MSVFRALILLLQGGMSFEFIQNIIISFLNAARDALFGGMGSTGLLHSEMFTIFAIIAVGFLTITFYSELIKEVTNETLTTEKFIAALCKLFIGAMVIFFIPEILQIIFNLVETMFYAATQIKSALSPVDASSNINTVVIQIKHGNIVNGLGANEQAELKISLDALKNNSDITKIYNHTSDFCAEHPSCTWSSPDFAGAKGAISSVLGTNDFNSYFNDYYEGVWLLNDLWTFIMCLIIPIVSIVALWGSIFAVVKAIIEFTVFSFLAPVGIINIFGENNKMIGVRYLKKLLAKGLTMAVMIIILAVCSSISGGMIKGALNDAAKGMYTWEPQAQIEDEEGNIVDVDKSSADDLVKNGELTLHIELGNNDLDNVFNAGCVGRCLIMQIAQVGLLLGAAKLADELFAG